MTDKEKEKGIRNRRTPKGVLSSMMNQHKSRARLKGWPPPDYDLKYLQERYLSDPEFLKLHAVWMADGYKRRDKPSLDRIDASKPYMKANIQMMTVAENYRKADLYERARTEVIVKTLDGDPIIRFRSLTDAARYLGKPITAIGDIGAACKDGSKTYLGYRWEYADVRKYSEQRYQLLPNRPSPRLEGKKFRLTVVRFWAEHPDLTVNQVAAEFGIARAKSIYQWRDYFNGRMHYSRHNPGTWLSRYRDRVEGFDPNEGLSSATGNLKEPNA